jgi:signal transduction histidine kinase
MALRSAAKRPGGSLGRRMIFIATAWISVLLVAGGFGLDRLLTSAITSNFENGIEYTIRQVMAFAEIGPDGEVTFARSPGDPRLVEANSGVYLQISDAKGRSSDDQNYYSPSLWDRKLKLSKLPSHNNTTFYDSEEFTNEPLLIGERDMKLPGSDIMWRIQVGHSKTELNEQIKQLRDTLTISLALLGLGLIILTALQTFYGLYPLRQLRHAIINLRTGRKDRIDAEAMPNEVEPLVNELNALIDHNEKQAQEAREHAGNLAHALKTPLTVIMNAATAKAGDLDDTVIREASTMRRQVDHHLARARAVGRRGHAHSRAKVWESLESVTSAVSRLYPHVRLDISGDKALVAHVERQDLDEILGNLVENAAKYGGGSVFVTVSKEGAFVELAVEDDGMGISEDDREKLFNRGARLDTSKPGTGLGLAIVRDVAEIYGGSVALEESEDMGGVLARLKLPAAQRETPS